MRCRLTATAIAVAVVGGLGAPSPAHATHTKLLTLAARVCPSFVSITANTARNNIMESLEDLGADSPYKPVGPFPKVMDPDVEAAAQPDCEPLANWNFTLGKGYKTRAVSGSFGSLSIVTDPIFRRVATQASVPLLSDLSVDTGRTIQGATTIELTDAEVAQANNSNLWVQGGTQTAPVADPDVYAFGALRCATDNVNGDNVEYVAYPTGKNHVFCFAYYVSPAPTAGTINIVKKLTPADAPSPGDPVPGRRLLRRGRPVHDQGERQEPRAAPASSAPAAGRGASMRSSRPGSCSPTCAARPRTGAPPPSTVARCRSRCCRGTP